jgi:hypothetical protein
MQADSPRIREFGIRRVLRGIPVISQFRQLHKVRSTYNRFEEDPLVTGRICQGKLGDISCSSFGLEFRVWRDGDHTLDPFAIGVTLGQREEHGGDYSDLV